MQTLNTPCCNSDLLSRVKICPECKEIQGEKNEMFMGHPLSSFWSQRMSGMCCVLQSARSSGSVVAVKFSVPPRFLLFLQPVFPGFLQHPPLVAVSPSSAAVLYPHFPFSVFSSHKLSPVLGNVKHLISIPETATGSPRDSIPGQESLTRHFLHSPFLLLPLFPLAAPNFSRSCSLNIIPSISSSCRA